MARAEIRAGPDSSRHAFFVAHSDGAVYVAKRTIEHDYFIVGTAVKNTRGREIVDFPASGN